ncbi:hypothetical protein LCGC14_1075850 [marine sediment metagenome]|uniref:Uncharacterized protein n=1 Tax=marine sediment metagenome TaxID=412755 RepID=A0A0F9MLK2_9ZZZZ
MPDVWMDVDIALSEVPINLLALTDDTTFKDREESVVYNQSGLDLTWNFLTTAGVYTKTVVTPTDTAGDYDWVNQGDGIYTIEMPASGGASINNDTEGFGWFTGIATGILHWRGPVVGFRAAALNNALIDGGDLLDVNLTEMGGVAQSATDLKDFADAGYDPAVNKVEGVKLVDTTTANSDMVGTDGANTTVPDAAGVAPTVAEIQAEMEENGASILDTLQDRLGTPANIDTGGATIADNLKKLADDNGGLSFDATTESLKELKDNIATASEVADAVHDEVIEGTLTSRQLMRIFLSALAGITNGGGTVTINFRDEADGKNRIVATVDVNGNRTNIVLDGT